MSQQRQITTEEAKKMVQWRSGDPNFVLVDKRTYQEYTISNQNNQYNMNNRQNYSNNQISFSNNGGGRFRDQNQTNQMQFGTKNRQNKRFDIQPDGVQHRGFTTTTQSDAGCCAIM